MNTWSDNKLSAPFGGGHAIPGQQMLADLFYLIPPKHFNGSGNGRINETQ